MTTQAKSARPTAGYIYILKPRLLINGQEVIKIGMTTRSVVERARELTTGSLVSFEIVYSLHVENARSFERKLHARYYARRLISGGGQEFFCVPAQEVVNEVERIAADISRTRALSAYHQEMSTFLCEIGASRVEDSISGRLGWLWFALWVAGTYTIYRASPFLAGNSGAIWLTLLAATIVLPVILSKSYSCLKRHYMGLYYEPRFRSAIEAKREKLRLKYPLAFY